jgi:hypothetical protein
MDFVKRLALAIVAALLLAGCTDDFQPQPYYPASYYPSNGYTVMTRPNYYQGYPPPVRYPQYARPVYAPQPASEPEPESPAVDTNWLSSFIPRAEAAPARPAGPPPATTNPDAGTYDCGWWRLCNLWN